MSGELPITLNTIHAEIKTLSVNVEGISRLVTAHTTHLSDHDDWIRGQETADLVAASYTKGRTDALNTVGISKRQLAAVSVVCGLVFSLVSTSAAIVVPIFF